nr:hypothetical protein GCM10025732_00740 [Glycomyces mayteni]
MEGDVWFDRKVIFMSVVKSVTRTAVAAAAAAAVFLPAAAASAQGTEIPEEGWEYSAAWDFVRDEYTAEFQSDVDDALASQFPDWTFDNSLEAVRLQNYYIDGVNETPVQRKFRADFWVGETGEGFETAVYLPGGLTPGIQDVSGARSSTGTTCCTARRRTPSARRRRSPTGRSSRTPPTGPMWRPPRSTRTAPRAGPGGARSRARSR